MAVDDRLQKKLRAALSILLLSLLFTTVFQNVVSEKTTAAEPTENPWPLIRGNRGNTGLSPYSAVNNSGEILWQYAGPGYEWMAGPPLPVVTKDGSIIVTSVMGNIYKISSEGREIWSQKVEGYSGYASIGNDGSIYVVGMDDGMDDGIIYSFSNEGIQNWDVNLDGLLTPLMVGIDDTLYVGSSDGNLYAINPDGSSKWTFQMGDNAGYPAIGPDGTIYSGSDDGTLYAIGGDGTEKWNFTSADGGFSPPVITILGDVIVSSAHKITILDCDGSIINSFNARGENLTAISLGPDGTIYYGSQGNKFYAFDQDGTEKWSLTTSEEITSSPIVSSDGTIFISTSEKLCAIDEYGDIKWQVSLDNKFYSYLAMGETGVVYVGSTSGYMYSIGGESAQVPSSPHNLMAIASDGEILLSWNAPIDNGGEAVIGYNIYRGSTSGAVILLASVANFEEYLDHNVTNNQTYYYQVRAKNSVGEGVWSNEVNATPIASGDGGNDYQTEDDDFIGDYWWMIAIVVVVISIVLVIGMHSLKRRRG